ncbi:MAG: glutamate racemase, partial [Acidimicrobiia bacterium]
ERLLAPVRAAGVDTLVLGCTHYPLLARTIGEVMGRDVVLVSSGEETAFEVAVVLDAVGARRLPQPGGPGGPGVSPGETGARHRFLTSGDPATFRTLGARFLGPEVEAVEAWRWS